MPLTRKQKEVMDMHIRSNTIYDWHGYGTDSSLSRSNIIRSIEEVLDSDCSLKCDLFLPNCFINGCENSRFWFKMAAIASSNVVSDWHELEYGGPLGREDLRQRYVYTWAFKGDTYRFYTKQLNDGYRPELVWYVGTSKGDADSSDDTDTDEIMLHSV